MDRELSERRITGTERFMDVAGKDQREVLGATVASVENLAAAAPQIDAAKSHQGGQDDRGCKPDHKLALANRREPQVPPPFERTRAV